jgi:hypothetical protein
MTCERSCVSCTWWSNIEPSYATATRRPAGADPEIGICQFSPPVVLALAGLTMTRFPETHATRTCGEWTDEHGGGPDDGERVGPGREIDSTVVPLRRVA